MASGEFPRQLGAGFVPVMRSVPRKGLFFTVEKHRKNSPGPSLVTGGERCAPPLEGGAMFDWDRLYYYCEWIALMVLLPHRAVMGLVFGDWWSHLLDG